MINKELSFNDIYKSFLSLCDDVEYIKSKLELLDIKKSVEEKYWMSIRELQNYLPEKPALVTIYKWVSKKMIPYYKKSKSLTFLKEDIDEWLKSGRIKTSVEITNNITEQVDAFLSTNKKKYKKQHLT